MKPQIWMAGGCVYYHIFTLHQIPGSPYTDQGLSQIQVDVRAQALCLQGSTLTSRQGLALGRGTKCTRGVRDMLRGTHMPKDPRSQEEEDLELREGQVLGSSEL